MNLKLSFAAFAAGFALTTAHLSFAEPSIITNPQIDAEAFLLDVAESHRVRPLRRVSEEQFLQMARDANTIVLDARNEERFAELHIAGATNLNFTEFTEDKLKAAIPSKDTRILIYCNNNIANSPVAFASKIARASLNLSTYTALFSYGYKNVYELGPIVDPAESKIKFQGSLLK